MIFIYLQIVGPEGRSSNGKSGIKKAYYNNTLKKIIFEFKNLD